MTDPQTHTSSSPITGISHPEAGRCLRISVLSLCLSFLLMLALAWSPTSARQADRVAIIVHPSNFEQITARDVYLIYVGRKTRWADGSRIMPFDHSDGESKDIFLRQFLNMDAYEYEEYWLERSIRGEGKEPPRKTAAVVKRLVAKINGAIGYIPESMIDDSVRVILKQ